MGKVSRRQRVKQPTVKNLLYTIPLSECISENKAQRWLAITLAYFRRIDTEFFARAAEQMVVNKIRCYNTLPSKYERDSVYHMVKYMNKSMILKERKWYKVNIPADVELQFYDREDKDGNMTHRNMPLRKKKRRPLNRPLIPLPRRDECDDISRDPPLVDRSSAAERCVLAF